jgi:DNA-binding response OmpR family regulator
MTYQTGLILLIDNDPEFAYLIERYCRAINWYVMRACSAEEALAQVQKVKPNMIMLNLLLPPYSGWEVLRALKQNSGVQGIPVTVYSSIPDEERAWGEGADFCLWKPVMLEEFIAALEAANLLSSNG